MRQDGSARAGAVPDGVPSTYGGRSGRYRCGAREGRREEGLQGRTETSSEAGGRAKPGGGMKCWVEKAKWQGSLMTVWQAGFQ